MDLEYPPELHKRGDEFPQFKHDDVKKAFYKVMNNAPYGKIIENVARGTDICLLNYMEKARRLAEKPHYVDQWYSTFFCQVSFLCHSKGSKCQLNIFEVSYKEYSLYRSVNFLA